MRASFNNVAKAFFAALVAFACSVAACGDDFDAACTPWCTVVDECTEASLSDCMNGCMEESSRARAISSECANAVRDQNLCLGELTCAEFDAWLDEDPLDGYPCQGADDGVENSCIR